MTRDELLHRVADILRRSGVQDAEALIQELERRVVHLGGRTWDLVILDEPRPDAPGFDSAGNRVG